MNTYFFFKWLTVYFTANIYTVNFRWHIYNNLIEYKKARTNKKFKDPEKLVYELFVI